MLDRLLPRRIDNDYRGHRLALWILGALAVMKLPMGANAIFNGREVAAGVDGIPLDAFPPDAARAVLALFAAWGLGQVLLGLACVLALVRYRAAAPIVFALLLVENVGRKTIFWFLPSVPTATTANVVVNSVSVALMLAGLALSLWRGRERR